MFDKDDVFCVVCKREELKEALGIFNDNEIKWNSGRNALVIPNLDPKCIGVDLYYNTLGVNELTFAQYLDKPNIKKRRGYSSFNVYTFEEFASIARQQSYESSVNDFEKLILGSV